MLPIGQEEAAIAIQARLIGYAGRLRLARATDLARSKRYLEAEALLCPMGRPPAKPQELDLLARIAFKRRRPADARRFWEAAMRADPANGEYQRCLEELQDGLEKRKFWAMLAGIVLSVAFAAFIGAGIFHFHAAHKDRHAKDRSQEIRQ